MKDYLFILGRDTELSLLELESYFLGRKIEYKVVKNKKEVLHLKLKKQNFQKMIQDLGGVSKIIEIIDDLNKESLYSGKKNKFVYALSTYDNSDTTKVKALLKERFKEEKIKAMLKKSQRKEPYLMPSEVIKFNLLSEGFEIVLFNKKIGKTIACYNPKEYEIRDKKRPVQRPLHTMSLRLAKILTNLTAAKPGATILDPFCGIGTLLQEALLEGYNVMGVDKDPSCIRSSQKNLVWIQNKYKTKNNVELINSNVISLKNLRKVDAVATEPYMGPFLKKLPTRQKAQEIVKKLVPLYDRTLETLAKKSQGRIVFVVPRFRLYNNKRISIPFQSMAKKYKLKPINSKFNISMPYIYKGKKSKIEREIWILERFK